MIPATFANQDSSPLKINPHASPVSIIVSIAQIPPPVINVNQISPSIKMKMPVSSVISKTVTDAKNKISAKNAHPPLNPALTKTPV